MLAACDYYASRKKQRIYFEYILIAGVNDADEQAHLLAGHARRLGAKVNLIPYNTVEGLEWSRPSRAAAGALPFHPARTRNRGHLRREKGHDIDAACGQLRLQTKRSELATGAPAPTRWASNCKRVRPPQKLLRACGSWPRSKHVRVRTEPDRVWDEYEWERFLQQQDHKTEKYMELLEKYLDHPQRDQIIAREMGWTQLLNGDTWSDEVDALLAEESTRTQNEASVDAEQHRSRVDGFEDHALYRAAFALTVWIDQLFDEQTALQNEPAAVKLATHSALASAKLAAALSDDDVDEIGMTIAYLKRALKAITVSMEAGAQLLAEGLITPRATRGPQATPLPGARRHHHPHGRIPGRVAPALRQPLRVGVE